MRVFVVVSPVTQCDGGSTEEGQRALGELEEAR